MKGIVAADVPVAQGSSRDDFTAFIGPHWDVMVRLARRLAPPGDWEDALQDAVGAAWRKRRQFDETRGEPRSWLLAIVANQCHKAYRRVHLLEEVPERPDRSSTDDPDIDLDLRAALMRLTRRQRTAVTLHYYLGLPISEVGQVMACSSGTVKSTLSDARTRLREQLGEEYR